VADAAPVPFVVAVDQGTSATKAVVVAATGAVLHHVTVPVAASYPAPGCVEQDAEEILASVHKAIDDVLAGVDGTPVALGLSTQRESAVVWERATRRPLGPVLGWQDRRTHARARRLLDDGGAATVTEITGLPVDPMFSALKWQWLLDDVDPDRRRSHAGDLAVGTVDSWLTANLTGEHRIEAGNASRTMLLDLDRMEWSAQLCDLFTVPAAVLPEIVGSATVTAIAAGASPVSGCPLAAVLADSHAALYAHGVSDCGDAWSGDAVKVTYGTGSSIMALAGREASRQAGAAGLVRTLAWQIAEPAYAVEGNILATGATVKWLAELVGRNPDDLAELAVSGRPDGVVIVPAFAGLGAPWWDPDARGLIANVTLGTTVADLARGAFQSIVEQVEDVVTAAEQASGRPITTLLADGGPTANDWLMQLQADVSGRVVERSAVAELSAVGAARLAAESVGVWDPTASAPRARFEPARPRSTRAAWSDALARSRLRPGPSTSTAGAG
jgi:glycerol kinase